MRASHILLHTSASTGRHEGTHKSLPLGQPWRLWQARVAQSGPTRSCQPHLRESDVMHIALVGLHGAVRRCALEKLSEINRRILSSSLLS